MFKSRLNNLNPLATSPSLSHPRYRSLSFSERALHEKWGRRLSRNFSVPLSCPSVSSWHYFSPFFSNFGFSFPLTCIWTATFYHLPLCSSSFHSLFICQFLQTTNLTSSNSLIPTHSFRWHNSVIVLNANTKKKTKKTCCDNLLSDCRCLIPSMTSATSLSLILMGWIAGTVGCQL